MARRSARDGVDTGDQRTGHPPTPHPRRRSRGRVFAAAGAVAAALLVVLGGGFGWPGWFVRDPPPAHAASAPARPAVDYGNPTAVARAYVRAADAKDFTALRQMMCSRMRRQYADGAGAVGGYQRMLSGARLSGTLLGPPRVRGDQATARLREHVRGPTMNVHVTLRLTMSKQRGDWLLCGMVPERLPNLGGLLGN